MMPSSARTLCPQPAQPAGQLRRDRGILVLFAETGLLVGIFLPGDSLLFTAGLLCSTKVRDAVHLSLAAVLIAAAAGALLGAQTGYLIGRKAGPPVLERR